MNNSKEISEPYADLDKLAELEKVILEHYLKKGYLVDIGVWTFNIEIKSEYKSKHLLIYFRESIDEHYSQVFETEAETTMKMFKEAIKYFKGIK